MIALDTNILIYEAQVGPKAAAAKAIIHRTTLTDCVVPLQVLAEFANACRRKNVLDRAGVSRNIANYAAVFHTPATTLSHIQSGSELAERYQLAFFDAMICAIALDNGASALLSEDMHDGLRVETLEIINPFRAENSVRLDRVLPG